MANTQSAKKRVRASIRKRDRNRSTRSAAKTLVSRARRPADSSAVSLTSEDVRRAISALDKAAEKGIIHRNNAARRKGRLMSALAKVSSQKPAAAKTTGKSTSQAKDASRATKAKSAVKAAGPAKAKS